MTGISIKNNFENIQRRIQKACEKFHRSSENVKLVAISKKQPIEKINELVKLGHHVFGENYVQELVEKQKHFTNLEWHLVGPLQKNKINKVVGKVGLIHSVDSTGLAQAIAKRCEVAGIVQPILIQMNLAQEPTKSGVYKDSLHVFLQKTHKLKGIQLCGLMTMPPLEKNPENSRKYFCELREIRDKIKQELQLDNFNELSMGTTSDFEVAIEEGATLIRVGEALLGPRE